MQRNGIQFCNKYLCVNLSVMVIGKAVISNGVVVGQRFLVEKTTVDNLRDWSAEIEGQREDETKASLN